MHPILNAAPPTLLELLTTSRTRVDLKQFDAEAARTTSMAQHVLDAMDKSIQDNLYQQRCAEQAEAAWIGAQGGEDRNWQRLLASQHLHNNLANIAAVATHLGLPFAQIVLDDQQHRGTYRDTFGHATTVAATLFGDDSFVVHVDGRLSVPDDSQEAVLLLEETSVDDLQEDITAGRAVVLNSHGMDLDTSWNGDQDGTKHPTGEEDDIDEDDENARGGHTQWTPVSEMVQVWYDHDDPPFEPEEEWSNISETPIMDELFELFLALAGADSTVSFSVESASNGNQEGIQDENLDHDAFPGDLFARIAGATIDFSYLTGGTWEYNDGPDGRKSGYSFSGSAAYVTYGPEEWKSAPGHKRLKARAHLLEMARTDPRLAELRDDIEAQINHTYKDQAA